MVAQFSTGILAHFSISIYSVNQENGWLGECSTEVERGEDLHMQGKRIPTLEE